MADDVNEGVERALKCLVSVTERSSNLRIDLKQDILEAVSSLRNYFVHLQTNLEAKAAAPKELEREVKQSKDEIQMLRGIVSSRTGHVESSHDSIRREMSGARQVLTLDGKERKLYSEAVKTGSSTEKR